ncbi:truncated xylose operon regulator [Escherichia coli]|nr:truncated xylose operon regulator [Escherichia coli]
MFTKRHRITLLFNANKAYDRQVVEGVGEYLQASQSEWDIFIEEDFRARIDKIKDWLGDGVIADFDDKQIEQALADVDVPHCWGWRLVSPCRKLPTRSLHCHR